MHVALAFFPIYLHARQLQAASLVRSPVPIYTSLNGPHAQPKRDGEEKAPNLSGKRTSAFQSVVILLNDIYRIYCLRVPLLKSLLNLSYDCSHNFVLCLHHNTL
jgi:hypothetical protein